MASFVLELGFCQSRDLENGKGLSVVSDMRKRPNARIEFMHVPTKQDGADSYEFQIYPMFATTDYHSAFHKGLQEAFRNHNRVRQINLADGEDDTLKFTILQHKLAKALRMVPYSDNYTLIGRLERDGQFIAQWMMKDPLSAARQVPDEFGS